ncbi:MAG: alanine--tRNA ligase [Fibrobacter sp.]|jgi:alanyl-tRNA synthetase|nr:alanine--tRNA ligase [Fibrobacter sp.]
MTFVPKTSTEIRSSFIRFFESKKHTFVRSAPVVPADDPTLMFTNAGMNQFKAIFLGDNPRGLKRAVNSQKCIRVSGKHNDLDEVGRDTYHHTFFEMLGNWSFGDYYKEEAITWAWELLTEVWKLDQARLFVTVYQDDDEAFAIWKRVSGLPEERIMRFDAKSNFWEMGDTGPCGPCSEIHYDRGDLATQKETFADPILGVNGANDRYIEIWNNVFMQYERISTGELIPLKAKNVDTGMGFERVCAILQGVRSNYDTDIFKPIIARIASLSGVKYDEGVAGVPHRVIADHLRSVSFAIADGALPSNEGRGYVLRRILRRASRFARLLEQKEPFIYRLVETLSEIMGDAFPEIRERKDFVAEVIRAEEERFIRTLDAGLDRFDQIVAEMGNEKTVPGDKVFLLYDTYGFPPDLTRILAEEKGLAIDEAGFETSMEEQKSRARAARKQGINTMGTEGWTVFADGSTQFVGYSLTSTETRILRYREDNGTLSIVLETTPFYAEMGGQVGDKGELIAEGIKIKVFDTVKVNDTVIHRGMVLEGNADEKTMAGLFTATVQSEAQRDTRRNHSATHLLQAMLREVLGTHVVQQGSFVSPEELRFDFSHFSALTAEQITDVENKVNAQIMACLPIETTVMDLDDARDEGVMALFGEKYEDRVRVVKIGDVSKELCGGLHAGNTGEIGMFKILSETSVSAGVRRMEAVTGRGALAVLRESSAILSSLRDRLRCKDKDILGRIDGVFESVKTVEKELAQAKLKLATQAAASLLLDGITVKGFKVFVQALKLSEDEFKNILDGVQSRLAPEEMMVISNELPESGSIAVLAGKALQDKGVKAGDLVKVLAEAAGGRGGGRADRAQAGTREPGKLAAALAMALPWIQEKLA